MKNIVLCFDHAQGQPQLRDATNARALFRLLDHTLAWYHPGHAGDRAIPARRRRLPRRRQEAADAARATVVEAYDFLARAHAPGDAVYLFGAGHGAYCARELARLLGVLGLPVDHADDLLDYLLATYALPTTRRSDEDWQRVGALAAGLAGDHDVAVPVRYLGLFDMVRVPGTRGSTGPLANVVAGRHAAAIDGGPFGEQFGPGRGSRVEEVWFRGAHCDVTGESGACWPLADLALDWVLDGAVRAGLTVRHGSRYTAPAPAATDALAGSAHMLSLRTVPLDAAVHASVEVYLRAHPQYWRRLPARIAWADAEWLARGERLAPTAAPVAATPIAEAAAAPGVNAADPVDTELLAATP